MQKLKYKRISCALCTYGFYGWLFHHNLIDLIRACVCYIYTRCIQQKRHNVSFGLVKMPPIISGPEYDARFLKKVT